MTIGERIKACLDDTAMTQRELAEKVGVTEVTLSRYIAGTRVPNAMRIKEIAKAIGAPVSKLIEEETDDEETHRLSLGSCMKETLSDYGIEPGLAMNVYEHMIRDLMDLLVRQGYANREG